RPGSARRPGSRSGGRRRACRPGLRSGVLVALVGRPQWPRELPPRRRERRDLERLVRMWSERALAEHANALEEVLLAASATRTPATQRRGSWLSLVRATVAVALHSDPARSARVLDLLGPCQGLPRPLGRTPTSSPCAPPPRPTSRRSG